MAHIERFHTGTRRIFIHPHVCRMARQEQTMSVFVAIGVFIVGTYIGAMVMAILTVYKRDRTE